MRARLRTFVYAFVLVLLGCGGGGGPTGNGGGPPVVATITIEAPAAELDALGATLQLIATALGADGDVIQNPDLAWSSSAPGVATVSGEGLVEAEGNGEATITVRAGEAVATVTITVRQVPVSGRVSPSTPTARGIGATLSLNAQALDRLGEVVPGVIFAFASGDDSVAVVDDDGEVTTVGLGSVEIVATADGIEVTATLTVQPYDDFSFLHGRWDVTSRFGPPGAAETTTARASFQSAAGGASIEELYAGSRGGGGGRAFHDPDGSWTIARVDADMATMTVYEGNFEAGVGTFVAALGGGTMERVVFESIGPNAFEWRAERSTDGGATWTPFWEQSFARGSTSPQAPDAGNCASPRHRDFDFWNGEWTAMVPSGQVAGTDRIPLLADGCLLNENWTGSGGGLGISYNMYDTRTAEWIQVWNGSGGLVLELRGGLDATGSMVLSGPRTMADGSTVLDRITWTPNSDGTVRQNWQSSTDGGATFSTTFEAVYSPQ